MNHAEYTKLAELEKTYWWHQGKVHLVKALLGEERDLTILEIGCGTGMLTKFLSNYGTITGIDISPEAISFCQKQGLEKVFKADINSMDITPHRSKYDLVVASDVLEHIQDDMQAMKNIKKMLKESGRFLLTVPAHKFLWSEHDEALHHKRRYHSLEITKKLKDAGFTVAKKTYFVATALPAIVLFRLWGNIFGKSAYPKTSYVVLPEVLNNLMIKLLAFEAEVAKKLDLPIGVTIAVVARKNPKGQSSVAENI